MQKIIEKLKDHYAFDSDTQLSNYLGVAQNTLSGWKRRNSADLELIISKCADVDLNWLFRDAPDAGRVVVQQVAGEVNGNGNQVNVTALAGEVSALRREVQLLRDLVAEKERVIELMRK
ncbi:MAG: helix-turn-helix domain-containing protein [Bacteroidia bacterium]|nr:helix-turn-helix domain-containing protein [Bacteroidia bacterium]